jgi:hypothetical protein
VPASAAEKCSLVAQVVGEARASGVCACRPEVATSTPSGHWKEATERAAAHREPASACSTANRPPSSPCLPAAKPTKQPKVTRHSAPAEPWEYAVQAILQVLCQHAARHDPEPGIPTMTADALALALAQDPATALPCTRIGLTVLDLASGTDTHQACALRSALIATASTDGYAARDVLASVPVSKYLTSAQRSQLQALISTCGLDSGTIPGRLHDQLTAAADHATGTLTAGKL